MKRIKILMIAVMAIAMAVTTSCTENSRAKNFGGTAHLNLPIGQKLKVVTWKNDALWVLTSDMKDTDVAESYDFAEESSWGVFEGNYIIKETK